MSDTENVQALCRGTWKAQGPGRRAASGGCAASPGASYTTSARRAKRTGEPGSGPGGRLPEDGTNTCEPNTCELAWGHSSLCLVLAPEDLVKPAEGLIGNP